ncbi:hypothetical protein M8397_15035, partial [Staphylococcus aureus]|nr:hypothetical protein [Staphylococcus aureus]
IEMFLLNTLRVNVLQQEGHKETLDPFFDYAKKILEPVILEVDEIIHQALSCKSTQNCDSLARKTLALLERLRDEAKEKQQEEDQNKDPQNDTDNSSGSENEPDSETNGDNQGEGDGDSEEQDDDAGNGKAPMEDNEPSEQSKGDEESA